MDISFASAAIALSCILLSIIYTYLKNRNVLPGPWGVPYLGLYPFLKQDSFYRQLDEYKKKYGDVFSFTYSGNLYINLGSPKAIRELHLNQSDCFMDRFKDFSILTYMLGKGVTMVNGEPWKVLRKFFIQRFRDHGLNTVRDDMAGPVYDSLNSTMEHLRAVGGKAVNVFDVLMQNCTVTIRKVIFGEEGITDEEFTRIITFYTEALTNTMELNSLLMGPFARLLFSIKPAFRRALNGHNKLSPIVSTCVKRVKSTMNEDNPTCIVEDFYKERNKRRTDNDPTWQIFNDEALEQSVIQFVGDGVLGVAAFLCLFLNALITHPEEQEKLYAELQEVVGPNRQPVMEDKPHLPYCNAFINEVLRKSTFALLFPSLLCTKETTIRGYRVPKGSITVLNFWSAHHDPNTFEEAEKFKPSRYLPAPGKTKQESPVFFGMGKRSCIGEAFVMAQSFLFLSTIIKNFKIFLSSDAPTESVDFLRENIDLIFLPRNEN